MNEPLAPEVVDEHKDDQAPLTEQVTKPAKLVRISSMVQSMREEARNITLDEDGRKLLAELHKRAMEELNDVLSPELKEELEQVVLPLPEGKVPSESEILVTQAQLIGWLEGLFHGIQLTMAQEAIQRQLLVGKPGTNMLTQGDPNADTNRDGPGSGAYL